MNYNEVLEKLSEDFSYKMPGPVALGIISDTSKRNFQLAKLEKTADGLCAWCNVSDITPPKRRYCSENCRTSAFMYCNPQSNNTKIYVLLRLQEGACRICGVSYEDWVAERAGGLLRRLKAGYCVSPTTLSYRVLGYGTGHVIQVDHITPIFKGGKSLGFGNIQVVCAKCHYEKTAAERK